MKFVMNTELKVEAKASFNLVLKLYESRLITSWNDLPREKTPSLWKRQATQDSKASNNHPSLTIGKYIIIIADVHIRAE